MDIVELGMREGSTTDDYRNAMSGEGDFGSLGYEWSDKPHRLVYDLCAEVDRLRSLTAEMEKSLKRINAISSPNPERTFDLAIKNLEWITSEARSALSRSQEGK